MTRKRNVAFDVLKVIATLMVVYQHACGTTLIERSFESIAKTAVPLFLMITGYYYPKSKEQNGLIRQMKKIFSYALSITFLYFLIELFISILKGRSLNFLQTFFGINEVCDFFLFNNPYVGSHAWYLWALLYVLIILYGLDKLNIKLHKIFITSILLIGLLCLGVYSPFLFHQKFSFLYYRNFLFIGLPYFLLGMILYEKRDWILEQKNKWPILTGFSIVLGFVEFFGLEALGVPKGGYYITTTLIACCVFALFMSTTYFDDWRRVASFGRKYSLYIYAFHVEVVVFEKRLLPMDHGFGILGFIIVLFISILISICFERIKEKGVKRWFVSYKN